jgi:cyclopropane-fatty-acyl-phospholipid synthase
LLSRLANWRGKLDAKAYVQDALAPADIQINGTRPWDLIVKDSRFYRRLLKSRSIGLGDSYMDNWWECADLEGFLWRILESRVKSRRIPWWKSAVDRAASFFVNAQDRLGAKKVAEEHYDLGNELYQHMLDRRMVYSDGRWSAAKTLDQAQEEKLRAVCEAIELRRGMHLLDIGCGWGGLAKFAAQEYGATVVGVTISERQAELARKRCAGLPVSILLLDYRDIGGEYDRIVSLGMIEHVGKKNYRHYFEVARRALRANGLFCLSTVGSHGPAHCDDPWMVKHIFPNSHIPSWQEIENGMRGLFLVEERENWAEDYRRTVLAWLVNFQRSWNEIRAQYDERFERMWKYYLCAAAAGFHAGTSECWDMVLSPR